MYARSFRIFLVAIFAIGDATLTVVQDVQTRSNEVRIRYRLQRLSVVEESRITQPQQSD